MHQQLTALRALVLRYAEEGGTETAIPGVGLFRASSPTLPIPGVYEPMLGVVLQGVKQLTIGDRSLTYDPESFFVGSLDLPTIARVIEASPERPFLALSIAIDRTMLSGLLAEVAPSETGEGAGFGVSAMTPQLLGSAERLVALLDEPGDVPMLAPMRQREVLYRLLGTEQGAMLREVARADSRLSQIRRAIDWIRAHYDAPLSISALAGIAGMSRASFHRHFRTATAMSPLQYQKLLRLQAARRLLMAEPSAQRAAHRVGYESASQFSREYARLFGAPPARDAARLRAHTVRASP